MSYFSTSRDNLLSQFIFIVSSVFLVSWFWKQKLSYTLCSQFMRFRIMRFSIYAVLENGPNSCFMLEYSHIMRFLFKIIVYKILLIFFLHLCYSCIMRFLLGNKKRINGKLSVYLDMLELAILIFHSIWK